MGMTAKQKREWKSRASALAHRLEGAKRLEEVAEKELKRLRAERFKIEEMIIDHDLAPVIARLSPELRACLLSGDYSSTDPLAKSLARRNLIKLPRGFGYSAGATPLGKRIINALKKDTP